MNTDNVIFSTNYKSERTEFFLAPFVFFSAGRAAWFLRIRTVTSRQKYPVFYKGHSPKSWRKIRQNYVKLNSSIQSLNVKRHFYFRQHMTLAFLQTSRILLSNLCLAPNIFQWVYKKLIILPLRFDLNCGLFDWIKPLQDFGLWVIASLYLVTLWPFHLHVTLYESDVLKNWIHAI